MIRLKEVIEYGKERGVKLKLKEFAKELYPNSERPYANLRNLMVGKTEKISPKQIEVICNTFGVDADYLLGFSEVVSKAEAKSNILGELEEIKRTIDQF